MNTEPDSPITLQEACKLYPGSSFKVATLKAAYDKGMLDIFLLGRRYHTTRAAMDQWVKRCREDARRRGCTSTASENNGLSEMDQVSSARAALSRSRCSLSVRRKAGGGNANRKIGGGNARCNITSP